MSDNQSDRPDDAAEGDEQAPTEEPPSHKKWFVAVAAVTALSVGLAAIGLAASSNEETAKSVAAAEPGDIADIKISGLIADNIENKVIGGIAGAGAGYLLRLGLEAGLSALGYQSQEQKTAEQLKEINGRLDQVSNQLTEINSHLDVMSEQIATIDSDVQRSIYLARSYRVDDAIGQITDVYGAYQALLCAKGIAVEQQLNLDSTGSLYNKDNCSRSVADYESDFKGKFSSATNSRFKLLHEQLLSSSTSPSILTDFVRVYMGDRKYFTFKDSVAMRNFFTNISEYEALDAYLQSEYYVLAGRKGEAEGALSTWYNNNRAERAIIPPMLPQGVVIHLPNGVGPVGAATPATMFVAPTFFGPTAPEFPNNRSVTNFGDLPLPVASKPVVQRPWNPTVTPIDPGPVNPLSSSPLVIPFSDSVIRVGDNCTVSSGAKVSACIEGTDGYERELDRWTSWGSSNGWRFPTQEQLLSLSNQLKPLVLEGVRPDGTSVAAGNVGVKLGYLAVGSYYEPEEGDDPRTAALKTAWNVPSRIWTGQTSDLEAKFLKSDTYYVEGYPYTERTGYCWSTWSRHQYVSMSYPERGVQTTPPTAAPDGILTPPDSLSPVGGLMSSTDPLPDRTARCAADGSLPSAIANLVVARPLTAAKGDDFLAQNAMSVEWPVIQPTGPSNLGTFFPDPSKALVTWKFPLNDGGAPITSYKVTASPSAGGGTAISCPIVYRQPDYPSFEAECAGLTAGTRYSFVVTATNSELLSGSAAITGPAAAPATATTVAPTTAPPAVSSTTTTTAPAASTTTAAAATRDASKNVEAESFDGQCSGCSGVVTKASDGFTSGGYIGGIATGDWVRFEGVNTPSGSDAKFAVRVASGATTTGTIELHADSPTGALLASVPVSNTGGWHTWTTLTAAKQSTLGTKPVYLVFKSGQSGDFVNVDWFKFTG